MDSSTDDQQEPVLNEITVENNIRRPTSIPLISENTSKKKNRSLGGLLMDLKREFSGIFMSDSSDAQKMKG